jgi:hypothetical protein
MLRYNKQDLTVSFPMQITPWDRSMPPGSKAVHAYYEDLACRIKIAVFLGLILTAVMLWAKISPVRAEKAPAESQVLDSIGESLLPRIVVNCLWN